MTQIDDAIRSALSEEDARLLERFRADLPLSQQVFESFRGQTGWVTAMAWLMGFAFFALGLYCGWRFLQASEVADMLRWGAALGVSVVALMGVKLWSLAELQKNAVVRELKRLELQVARLAAR